MKQTYEEAMQFVYEQEGGYSNDAGDPGGPTKYGITLHDARSYWKPTATAEDVKNMPKSVAAEIYAKHYASPIRYDDLPSGVDLAVLDYGINSGISRSAKVLQAIVGVPIDGRIGPQTIAATYKKDPAEIVTAIFEERLRFLRGLHTWSIFGKGWGRRCVEGKALALSLIKKYPNSKNPPSSNKPAVIAGGAGAVIAAGASATLAPSHAVIWVLLGVTALALIAYTIVHIVEARKNVT